MTTSLFLVTYRKDFPYLKWCLASVAKFCTGFQDLKLLVPYEDADAARAMLMEARIPFCTEVISYEEVENKGMLQHMVKIMEAPDYTTADFVAHIDADCLFTDPVDAADLFIDGKAILRYEMFDDIIKRHDAMERWRVACNACLPFKCQWETMRAHPGVFHRATYQLCKELIEKRTNTAMNRYIMRGPNVFPQDFCEFNTLGNVAMQFHQDKYHPVQQTSDCPEPDNKLQQFWGHGPIDKAQNIWVKGQQKEIVPIDFIKAVMQRWVPTEKESERMAQ